MVIQGVPAPLYDHVVVDEAQDVAPLYYAVLKRLSRNGSFTILGDVAQGLHSYRGIADWDDVRRVFDDAPYHYNEVSESYRSTHEIITFANRILELLNPAGQKPLLAKPFERRGAPVRVVRLARPETLAPELTKAINALTEEGYQNIAIIAKTFAHCAALADDLRAHGLESFQVAAPSGGHYAGGVFVLPVHLAKGMEFEAVLIAGADDQTYSSSEFDGRLLYVAVTRALHVLHVFAGGALNVHLELAESVAAGGLS
jgi:DNA helicase-2/ATP-dependent DNA helicase PcrA